MSSIEGSRENGIPRACESCFRKKIRCDKKRPCSACKATSTACQSAPRRPKEHKQRVLISTQYERKIDLMDERLSGIEESLRTLVLQSGSGQNSRLAGIWSAKGEESAFNPVRDDIGEEGSEEEDEDENEVTPGAHTEDQTKPKLISKASGGEAGSTPSCTGTAFEGETSIKAHTTRATQILEDELFSDIHAEQSPEMTAAFANLRKLLAAQNKPMSLKELRFPKQGEVRNVELSDLELPQPDLVLSMLRKGQQKTPLVLIRFPCLDHAYFAAVCQKVFFATEPYTLGHYALAMGGLHILFSEFKDAAESPQQAEAVEKCADICGMNFLIALSKYPLLVPPTLENIQVLFIAAEQAAELSRPSMAWMYVTTAAQLCLTLGYHRKNPTREDDLAKRRIFWFIYILERDISLQLGRSSQIQDDDINVLKPEPSLDAGRRPWDTLVLRCIEVAKIEGRIYRELFGAAALGESSAVRTQRARNLASDLDALYAMENEIDYKNACYKEYFELELELQRANFYSKLALIYQVLPPKISSITGVRSGYSDECVAAARKSLCTHRHLVSRFAGVIGNFMTFYAEWGVLGHPFIPFTVVFSQAITMLDIDDLSTLSEIVAIMERAKRSCSKITRLHHVCSVLYHVAKVYVEDRLAKVMDGQCAENNGENAKWTVDSLHGEISSAADAAGPALNGVMGYMNSNNGLFAMPSELPTSVATATAAGNGSVAGMDPTAATATATATATTASGPASLGFVNLGSGISMSAATTATLSAAGGGGGGRRRVENMGNINFGAALGAGGGAAGTSTGANAGIGGGRFLDDTSLSMMEMGGSPTFGWLPTGQDMVSLLDTDMDVFDT